MPDIRQFDDVTQARLRSAVIRAVHSGASKSQAARRFGVSRQSVYAWTKAWQDQARPRRRETEHGSHRALDPVQEREMLEWSRDELREDPCGLGPTRRQAADRIAERWGLHLSLTTVGRYLRRWLG